MDEHPLNTRASAANVYQPPGHDDSGLPPKPEDDIEASIIFTDRICGAGFIPVATTMLTGVALNRPHFLTTGGKGMEMGPINVIVFFGILGFAAVIGLRHLAPHIPVNLRGFSFAVLGMLALALPAVAALL